MFGSVVLKEQREEERREGQFDSLKIKYKMINNHKSLLTFF